VAELYDEPEDDEPRNHRSYGPLTKILIGMAIVLSVCCAYLVFAVSDQAQKVEDLEAQMDRMEAETNRIGRIADQVTTPSKPSPELQRIFQMIEEIHKAVVTDAAATEGE